MLRIGLAGSGFVAGYYCEGLANVAGQQITWNLSLEREEANVFGHRWSIPNQTTDPVELCNRPDVDLVIVATPNASHRQLVELAAAARKPVVCAKPLGRTAAEAAEMVELVRRAGITHGYAETEVFAPAVVRVSELIESGALGRVLTVRSREAHSGPHAEHFWDTQSTGGGALLDMGCHMVEVSRMFFGKDHKPEAVFAWGATLVHGERTNGEDNAVFLVRFAGERVAVCETSWTTQGGMELRNEVYGTTGRAITDTHQSNVVAFTAAGAGYVVEKADVQGGWVNIVPEEAFTYGYHGEMRHFVECATAGTMPRETFVDGYIVNAVIDAAYRSMRSGRWEDVSLDADIVG
jgi:predicted dehydrogenase